MSDTERYWPESRPRVGPSRHYRILPRQVYCHNWNYLSPLAILWERKLAMHLISSSSFLAVTWQISNSLEMRTHFIKIGFGFRFSGMIKFIPNKKRSNVFITTSKFQKHLEYIYWQKITIRLWFFFFFFFQSSTVKSINIEWKSNMPFVLIHLG